MRKEDVNLPVGYINTFHRELIKIWTELTPKTIGNALLSISYIGTYPILNNSEIKILNKPMYL